MMYSVLCTDISHLKLSTDPHQATFHELRLSKRLGDKDLRYHVGRIYLEGVNSPFHWLGGAWELPLHPPPHLKGLFVDEEEEEDGGYDDVLKLKGLSSSQHHVKWSSYAHFVAEVNAAVQWEMGGWEVGYYFFLLLCLPPRAERFLVRLFSLYWSWCWSWS